MHQGYLQRVVHTHPEKFGFSAEAVCSIDQVVLVHQRRRSGRSQLRPFRRPPRQAKTHCSLHSLQGGLENFIARGIQLDTCTSSLSFDPRR